MTRSEATMDEFEKLFPGLAEKIFEQFYGDADHGFEIYDKQSLDREGGNFQFWATCWLDSGIVEAKCQDGNWNGSEILLFDYEKTGNNTPQSQRDYDKCTTCGSHLATIIGDFKMCERCNK